MLCRVPQFGLPTTAPRRTTAETRSPAMDLRAVGVGEANLCLGARSLSAAFRHRNDVSAVERGTHAHLHASARGAVVDYWVGVVVAERLGVAALRVLGDPAARATPSEPGAPASGFLVALAGARCRNHLRSAQLRPSGGLVVNRWETRIWNYCCMKSGGSSKKSRPTRANLVGRLEVHPPAGREGRQATPAACRWSCPRGRAGPGGRSGCSARRAGRCRGC